MTPQTLHHVRLQLSAMDCDRYEVGILDSKTNRMQLRDWPAELLLEECHLSYLGYRNGQGCHIYVRPSWPHALTLLDDISETAVRQLHESGYEPALVVQTSPDNYQAWLKHPDVLAAGHHEASSVAARLLARKFGADPNSADWRHFGRLAGYTNRKPKYQNARGLFPFVRVVEHRGAVYSAAASFVGEVTEELSRLRSAQVRRRDACPGAGLPLKTHELLSRFSDFQAKYEEMHRADFAFALWALARGVAEDQVRSLIDSCTKARSANGGQRRRLEYLRRTVENARAELGR